MPVHALPRRLFLVASAFLLLSSCPANVVSTTRPQGPITVAVLPASWTSSQWEKSTAIELFRTRQTPQGAVRDAQILITTEKRRSHGEAVERLGEIADESKEPPAWLLIDGWPALQRRQTVIAPRPSAAGEAGAGPERQLVLVTTAVAAGDQVIRAEGSLPVEVAPSVAPEVEVIGRGLTFSERPKEEQSNLELQRLRIRKPSAPPVRVIPLGGVPKGIGGALPGAPSFTGGTFGELELAVSSDGLHVVVAEQKLRTVFSDDGGRTINSSIVNLPMGMGNNGDPSIAIGASGTFYLAFLSVPSVGSCGAALASSSAPNNGATFTFVNNAVFCGAGGGTCFPDQEHIAADPNPASSGGDQIYVVWRNFGPIFGNCNTSSSFYPFPSITCSSNGGASWRPPAPLAAGDLAHVTVGGDGFVWVVQRAGGSITINKLSSCETGLVPQAGFPKNVVAVSDPECPVAGLDRCLGSALSSATAAVDRSNPNHVFIAFANSTSSTNDDIVLLDSTDGFAAWPSNGRTTTLSSAVTARRFMPWMCTLGSNAEVTWYDRRAAGPGTNDLTAFFRGSGSVVGTALVSGPEVNVSVTSDPECATGFPCGHRNAGDDDTCPTSPQLDGTCKNGSGTGSLAPCDQDGPPCAIAGEACFANFNNSGCPKYGDYNGTACAAGHVFATWASATPPPGLPPPGGIGVFVDAMPCGGLGQSCCTSGSACTSGLTCSGSTCAAVACGGVGQPCCSGGACGSGSGCLSGTCATCPPAARTLIDSTAHNGADCGGTSQAHPFAPACDLGFQFGTCTATLVSEANGSTCSPTPTGHCSCSVTVTTPADCLKWATCRVVITEVPIAPVPAGCP